MRNSSVPKTARAGGHRTASRWGAPLTSLLGALVLVIGLVVPIGTVASAAAPSGTVGAACAPGTGVTAVVDFATTDADTAAPVRIGCAPGVQTSIRGAFTAAGFDLGADAFTCAIDGVLAEPRGCGTWPGAYWSLFTSTDTGTFPGTPVTAWNYASTGVDNGAQVPVGSAVLYQIQPDAPDRTPRITLADLAVTPSGSSSSASSPSENSSDTASSASTPSSSESSPSQGPSPSQDPSPSQESSSSQSTGPSSSATSSDSSGVTTGPTTASPAPTLPPVIPTTDARALAAAHWLGEQLANAPNGLFGNPDFPDYGLTIDALLALSAAGVGGDLISATAAKIQRSGEDYIGAADDTAGNFARIAKTALALQVAGLDPTAFPSASGSRDLIAELRGTLNADGSFGGSDFPFVHALALYSLARTAEGVPPTAISWLESTQCRTAGNENFGAYGYDGTDPCSGVDGDGTALAIQALAAANVPATDPSIKDAAAYLLSIQGDNGGVPSSFGGINTNNTGLAAQALDRVQLAPAATMKMAGFVGTLQVQCSTLSTPGKRFYGKDLGAIAYMNDGGFDSPITTPDFDNRDQWIRATTQAIFAYHLPSFDRITAAGALPALPAAPECAPGGSTPPSATPTAPNPTAPNPTAPTTTAPATITPPATSIPIGGTSSAAPFPGTISLDTGTVVAGGSLTVTVTDSLIAARHRVELHSTPVLLGTFVTDAAGDGSLTVRIPSGTAAGRHEIVVTAGDVVLTARLSVTAAAGSSSTADPVTTSTAAGPITTPVDSAGNPLPNTGVSQGMRTLLIAGGLLLVLGAALLMLARRRTRSAAGAHLS